ncbi:MAG: ABC transporter substrate-binding protein [Clostridia bacterium]|nr:ABC transporter substrate-binding protein [Clostridia bacterium]
MKKLISALLIAAMMLSLCAVAFADEGTVLNIFVWNDEWKTRFTDYYTVPEGVTVNWIEEPNAENNYQNKLDAALQAQDSAPADKKVDIFLVEADYAVKYMDLAYDIADLGITAEDIADMYQYTLDIMTDAEGKIKGLSWQACPAGLIYRRDLALEVLGTDDPETVQEMLCDWESFEAVAEMMADAGIKMVSGYDDTYRTFTDNMSTSWVVDGKIQKDAAVEAWIAQTKKFTENGWNNGTKLWDPDWSADMAHDSKVFCYFGPAWFFDYSMGAGTAGDWAVCEGPVGFSWGGTWICAAKGTDNEALVADIIKTMTIDKDVLTTIVKEKSDFTNSVSVMEGFANDPAFGDAFLGGQNYVSVLLANAQNINRAKSTMYDQTCTEQIQNAMHDYFNGIVDLDTAWNNFYTVMLEKHPELSF